MQITGSFVENRALWEMYGAPLPFAGTGLFGRYIGLCKKVKDTIEDSIEHTFVSGRSCTRMSVVRSGPVWLVGLLTNRALLRRYRAILRRYRSLLRR